ncbi:MULTISPECIES: glycosyltransferase [Fusobacterium]|uniref:glycosyltransferase n=1 Tax=Fusobacterium TaxID=848 RepID=UPI001477644C|nr:MULTISPECIES: glycosyltransferase [Fusobacterium]NME35804.1 glycosyltransferase family 4 protein [Fusobacterium sp. FSA-380-WT-3A]
MKKIKMILGNSFKSDIRVLKEARTLVKNGYDVEVLAWDRENELLNKEKEEIEGIKIKRFYPKAKYGTGKKQIFAFIKFVLEVKKYLKNEEFHYLHCHDLDGLIVGYFCKSKDNKLIYDSHEFFAGYKSLKINKKVYLLEKILLRKVNQVISVSDSICCELQKMYKLAKKPILIRNIPYYYKIDEKNNLLREEFNISQEKKILLFQGVFLEKRGIENLILMLTKLPKDFILILIGKGKLKEKLLKLIEENKLENRIYFKEFIKNEDLLKYTNSADLAIYLLPLLSLNSYHCLPNKLFEYIQGEIPVLFSNYPNIKEIIEKYNVGLTVDFNDKRIVDKVEEIFCEKFYKSYIKNIKIAKKELCWEIEEKKLVDLYNKLNKEV